jgi:hypothetical protein
LEVFLRGLPELSEDDLTRLKLGQTADTAKADIILAVISALSDSEYDFLHFLDSVADEMKRANNAMFRFLLQRLGGTVGQTLDSKLLQVLKRRLETPSFWDSFVDQDELVAKVISAIFDERTRADGMAIMSTILHSNRHALRIKLQRTDTVADDRRSRTVFDAPSFRQKELFEKVLLAIVDQRTRADGMAIISAFLHGSRRALRIRLQRTDIVADDRCSRAVFDAGIFDMLLDDDSEWKLIFLAKVIEKRPGHLGDLSRALKTDEVI